MNPTAAPRPAAILDASFVIAICANEPQKIALAQSELAGYQSAGRELYAPGILFGEVLSILCKHRFNGLLTGQQYDAAIRIFVNLAKIIQPPPNGDASLVSSAATIQRDYGGTRANDSYYIALALSLRQSRLAEIVTFDDGMRKQAKAKAPAVTVKVLPVPKIDFIPHGDNI